MNLTVLFGVLLALEVVGDVCYRMFYRMVGRNKYRVGDIVWVKVNDTLEPAEIFSITWKCYYRNEYAAKPEYHVRSLGGVSYDRELEQSEILCKFNGKDKKKQ